MGQTIPIPITYHIGSEFGTLPFNYLFPKENDKAYVSLRKNNKYWEAIGVEQEKPKTGLFIKGIIFSYDSFIDNDIKYGIEEYFIPENTRINFDFNKGEPYVKVAIDKNGNAVLKQPYVYDTAFEEYAKKYPPASPQQKSRDARRVSDTRQLQLALELYFDGNDHYPAGLDLLLMSNYIASLPKDPISGEDYIYAYYPVNNPSHYHLGAILEVSGGQLDNDSDCNSSIKDSCASSIKESYVNGFNGDDNGACGVDGAKGFCFDVIP